MKNILIFFVLSLFSIHGYASSCPDDSEPVKSISDDGTYFVFNCQSSSDNNKSTQKFERDSVPSKSIFVSDEDFSDFLNLPLEDRIRSCGYSGFSPNWRVINKDLAPRIKGYNSKMDNDHVVEGHYTRDVHLKYHASQGVL